MYFSFSTTKSTVMIWDGKLYTRNGQARTAAEAAMPPMRKSRRFINQSRRKGRLHQSEDAVVASSFQRFIIGFRRVRFRSSACSGDNSPHMRRRRRTIARKE